MISSFAADSNTIAALHAEIMTSIHRKSLFPALSSIRDGRGLAGHASTAAVSGSKQGENDNDRKIGWHWKKGMEAMKRADPTQISPWPASQEIWGHFVGK